MSRGCYHLRRDGRRDKMAVNYVQQLIEFEDGKNLFYRSVVRWLLHGNRCNFCVYCICCRIGSSESPDRRAEELSVPESIWIGKQRPT